MDAAPARPRKKRRIAVLLAIPALAALSVTFAAVYRHDLRLLRAAQAARRGGHYGLAERHLASCWRLTGLGGAWGLEHDLIAVQQGNLADEADWQRRARAADPASLLILEALAKGQLAVFQWNEARGYANAILERDPSHAQALWIRGQVWTRLQQEPLALDDFRRALASDPSCVEIRLSRAELLHKLGHVRQADREYLRLLGERPGDLRVWLALAHTRQEEGQLEDARKLIDGLLASEPNSASALIERGRISLREGRLADAEQDFRKAFAARPDDSEAAHLLELCLDARHNSDPLVAHRRAETEPAQVAVRLKLQDAPRDKNLLVEQGRWVLRGGDWREAVGWFYLALQEDPSFLPAHAELAQYFALADQPLRSQHHARLAGVLPPSLAPAPPPGPDATIALKPLPPPAPAPEPEVRRLCAACHAYPPPESFPRENWRQEVKLGFDQLRDSVLSGPFPSFESVVAHYEQQAPERLARIPSPPEIPSPPDSKPAGFRFEPLTTGWLENVPPYPGIANLHLADVLGDGKLELLASDTRLSRVLLMKPYGSPDDSQILPQVLAPCRTAVVDLDGDGRREILVASLGQFFPTDAKVGSLEWVRLSENGKFESQTLLSNVGRVSDVQAGDFNGDGRIDLIVAAFGWRRTGEILYLENESSDARQPRFVPHTIDPRHGAIHVPAIDLDQDGRLDFVALLSQEHETVVAYLNQGEAAFRPQTLFTAPHPAYGSSGIEVVDLDGDGDRDVLLTNGDVLDRPYLLKPYHGIQWLENEGSYHFKHHLLAPMYGASRAVAADFDNDQDLDIIAVAFLPRLEFPERQQLKLPSILLLEQTTRGNFQPHTLETSACDHFTCAAGDWDQDGDADFAVGNFSWKRSHPIPDAATLWFNRSERK